jgi:hypothetical protein
MNFAGRERSWGGTSRSRTWDTRFIARPPPQIRTCGFHAYGSHLGCVTAKTSVCVPAPVTRMPGSASGACFAGPHSPWSPPFAPPAPRLAPPQIALQGAAPLCSRIRASSIWITCPIGFSSLVGCSFILEEASNPESAKDSVRYRTGRSSPLRLGDSVALSTRMEFSVHTGGRSADRRRIWRASATFRHIREVEKFAAVRERNPGVAQACEVLALVIIVCVFGQSRHSSGRLPSGFALLHVIGSILLRGKHATPRLVTSGRNFY